jgi:hypothetical protein
MAKKVKKRKGRMGKGLFGFKFATTKVKRINENKVCFQNGNVPIAFEFWVVIHVCYNQQTLALQGRLLTPKIWAIAKVITSTWP